MFRFPNDVDKNETDLMPHLKKLAHKIETHFRVEDGFDFLWLCSDKSNRMMFEYNKEHCFDL